MGNSHSLNLASLLLLIPAGSWEMQVMPSPFLRILCMYRYTSLGEKTVRLLERLENLKLSIILHLRRHTISSACLCLYTIHIFLSRNVLHTLGSSLADYHISGSPCSVPYNTCTRN
uniref:Predicted protein n=1 Tax=Hordeum vulgare subsp. vulgare TaxID=112509 RepID=F2D1B2_HORVV|nr:predicted protein [Hordeum vulgare subsp. vulgare]